MLPWESRLLDASSGGLIIDKTLIEIRAPTKNIEEDSNQTYHEDNW